MREFFAEQGTLAKLSCHGAHAQNGVVEHKHLHLLETAHAKKIASIPPSFFRRVFFHFHLSHQHLNINCYVGWYSCQDFFIVLLIIRCFLYVVVFPVLSIFFIVLGSIFGKASLDFF